MLTARRYLPPLTWLTAFEAVSRLGSVTDAANELDLTQGAVSRQVQKLEELIEIQLFHREKRRLVVTPAGRRYASEIQAALAGIANATLAVQTNPDGGLLELAILPAFGTHWLAPRLPEFLAENPGVTINLATRMEPFDFSKEKFHAAIHFGQANWLGADALKLMDEEMVPVVAPSLAGTRELTTDLFLVLPRLYLASRVKAWQMWFHERNVDVPQAQGIAFDQFATMLQAAVSGTGAALMPHYLVEKELADGSLIAPQQDRMISYGAYYLVWPEALEDYPPVSAFRKWIGSQLGEPS